MAYSLWSVCRVRLRTVSLPRLCGARSAPYCRVYPKTVRRTVVLCRGGPVWPPTPGQPHRVAPTAAPALSGYERVQVGVFLLPPLMHQFSVATVLLPCLCARVCLSARLFPVRIAHATEGCSVLRGGLS